MFAATDDTDTRAMADHLCAMQAGQAVMTTNGVVKNAHAANLGDASIQGEPQTNAREQSHLLTSFSDIARYMVGSSDPSAYSSE